MRIGIDARMIDASGIGRYLKNLLIELQKKDTKNEYFIFLLEKDFEEINFQDNFKKIKANFIWYTFKEQLSFPRLLNKYNLDLVHFPHINIPVLYKGKFIVTVHDLIHMNFKMKQASTHNGIYYEVKHQIHKVVFNRAIKMSQKIITVSNYVREELEKRYKLDSSKLVVTYEACDEKIIEIAKKIKRSEIEEVLKKYEVSTPFIFYVGNAHPHKNIEGLIKVFLKIRKDCQYLQLVLAGFDHFFWERLKKEYKNKDIKFVGQITDSELVALYKSAKAYVFPSFSEGFGIPLLEAMACGCPVVSSNKTSLPEIGGDAAMYFDPYDLDEMGGKVMEVLNKESVRKYLIEKGNKRVKEFSWKKLAEETLNVYKNC